MLAELNTLTHADRPKEPAATVMEKVITLLRGGGESGVPPFLGQVSLIISSLCPEYRRLFSIFFIRGQIK